MLQGGSRTSQGRPTKGYWWAHGPSPRLTVSRPCSSHGWLVEAAFTSWHSVWWVDIHHFVHVARPRVVT
eukprot:scaffold136684_cov253-Phaeocystis_antarctica.AAC.1